MESVIYAELDGLIIYTTHAVLAIANAKACMEDGDWITIWGLLPGGAYKELSRFRKDTIIGLSRKITPVGGGPELVDMVLQ